jgi:hypothetical protein
VNPGGGDEAVENMGRLWEEHGNSLGPKAGWAMGWLPLEMGWNGIAVNVVNSGVHRIIFAFRNGFCRDFC